MTLVQKIFKNTSFLTISEVVQKVLLFFLIIYAVRVLGAVNFGKYSFAVAFTYFFLFISELGLTTVITRDVARDTTKTQQYFSNLFLFKLVLFLIAYILIYILINLLGYPKLTILVVMIFAVVTLGDDVNSFLLAFFKAHQNMGYVAISKILQNCLIFIFGGLALYLGYGVIGFGLAFAGATIITILISVIVIRQYVSYKSLSFKPRFVYNKLKVSLWFVVITILQYIIFKIDTVMLSLMKGDAEVGIYNSAYIIITSLLFIPGVYCTVAYPLLSKFFLSSKTSLMRLVGLSSKYLLAITIPMSVGLFCLAEKIISLIYSPEFIDSAKSLHILAPALFFLFFNYLLYNIAYAVNLHKKMIIPFIVGAILNIVLNYILIPIYGPVGAAIATSVTELVMLVMTWYILHKSTPVPVIINMIRPVIAASLMALVIIYFIELNLFILIPLGGIVYAISLLVLGFLSKEDIHLIKELFGIGKK